MSHHHRLGQSADLINPAPTTGFFNTIGQKRTFIPVGKLLLRKCALTCALRVYGSKALGI